MSTTFRQGKLNIGVLLFTVFHKQTCTDHLGSTAESRGPEFSYSSPCTLTPKACKQNRFCILYFFILFTNITEKRKIHFQVTFENYLPAVI